MYLATLAEQETENANIFNPTFLQQLCTRLSEQELSSKSTQVQVPHLDLYLQTHPLPNDVRDILKDFPNLPRDAMCQEASTAMHAYVSEGFEARAKSHITCALEKSLWRFRGESSERALFLKRLERLASVIFFVCSQSESEAV